ncbi:MAG: MFS transporter, partial [Erysipelotrichaceae bacterium]|nr:MFS transporter [Erysipelotrichaceae bacterium]
NSFGVFFSPIAETLSQKRGSVALFYTIMAFSAAFFSVIVSSKATNKNYKKFYVGGIICCMASLVLMANASGLAMLYAGGLLLGASFSPFFMVMITTVINCSIEGNVGTITGIVFSFSGIAGAIFSPLFAGIIEKTGWNRAFYIMAAMTLVLCLPGVFADMKVERENSQADSAGEFNYFQFGYICVILMSVCYLVLPAFPQHFPGLATSKGLDPSVGPLLVSAAMIGNIVFKLIAGILVDKLGSVKSMLIMTFINMAGNVLLLITNSKYLAMAAAFLFGAIYSVTAVVNACHVKELYGADNYKKAYSVVSLAGNISNALAVSAVGYVYDFFSSYDPALIMGLMLGAAAYGLAVLSARKKA